ncbi:NAD(+) synthase, partial [Candidatus Microgenomates bacterium]|nr:NAD(+) synthase [Candidatus Microgenomates bacterium]
MNLEIDCQKTTTKLTEFIQSEVKKAGFKKVIIGLSGGIDSAVSLVLAVKALAKENVFVVILPYGKENKKDLEDALLMIKHLKIPFQNLIQINIQSMVDSFLITAKDADQIRKGNIIARVRMILLYDLAKKHQALVCGTENKSEHVLGYYTRFGDEASDLEPIRGYYKTQIRQLAEFLNIPEKIINKPPS